jgi:RNA polymerase sigma-70 factor, ECF subfamily
MFIDLEKIYFLYREPLMKFSYSLSRNKTEAEDILQETFVKLVDLNKNKKIDNRNLKSFLFRIAYNLYIDNYRKESRIENLDLDSIDSESIDKNGKAKTIDALKFKQVLIQAISNLQVQDRVKDVLRFRIFMQMDFSEIAEILKTSDRTAYRDFNSGLQNLSDSLLKSGYSMEDLYEE